MKNAERYKRKILYTKKNALNLLVCKKLRSNLTKWSHGKLFCRETLFFIFFSISLPICFIFGVWLLTGIEIICVKFQVYILAGSRDIHHEEGTYVAMSKVGHDIRHQLELFLWLVKEWVNSLRSRWLRTRCVIF